MDEEEDPYGTVARDPIYGDRVDENIISSQELCELTGASYRQIDYWCRQGIISPIGVGTPGSGSRRMFDLSMVDRVRLVVKVSKAFGRDNSPLKELIDAYNDGEFDLGDGIHLTWDVIEIERGD